MIFCLVFLVYTSFCNLQGGGAWGLAHRESGSHWLLNRTATVIHVSNWPTPSPACAHNWVGKYLILQSVQYLLLLLHVHFYLLQTVILSVSFTDVSMLQAEVMIWYDARIFSGIKQLLRLGGCFVLVSRTIFKFTSQGGTNFQFRKFQEISLWHAK